MISGQILSKCIEDRYPALWHRVLASPQVSLRSRRRHSMAFFLPSGSQYNHSLSNSWKRNSVNRKKIIKWLFIFDFKSIETIPSINVLLNCLLIRLIISPINLNQFKPYILRGSLFRTHFNMQTSIPKVTGIWIPFLPILCILIFISINASNIRLQK